MPFNPFGSQDFGSPAGPAIWNQRERTEGMGGFGGQPAGAVGGSDAWSRMFGASTPSSLVRQRDANGGQVPMPQARPTPTAPNAPPAAPGSGTQQGDSIAQTLGTSMLSPTSTPEQAGVINSLQPGFFTGNPPNGQPGMPQLPQQPQPPQGLPDVGMAQAMQALGMQQQPEPVDQGPSLSSPAQQAMQDFLHSQQAAQGQMPDAQGLTSNAVTTPDQEDALPDAPPGDGGGNYGGNPGTDPVTGPFTGNWWEDEDGNQLPMGSYPGGFITSNGKAIEWKDLTWEDVRNRDNLTALDYINNNPNWWQGDGIWQALGINPPAGGQGLPDLSTWNGDPMNIPKNATIADLANSNSPYYIADPALRRMAEKALDLSEKLAAAEGNNSISPAVLEKMQRQSNQLQAALAQYGYSYDPRALAEGGGPTQGPGGNFDEWTQTYQGGPDLAAFVNSLVRQYGFTRAQAIEFAEAQYGQNQGELNKQRGVNILKQMYEQGLNDPIRNRSEQELMGFFDDPDGIDWQGIRNRRISDMDASTQQMQQGLSQSAARRGLSPGSVQGMSNELQLGQGNALARALGELTTQQQGAEREGMWRAIAGGADFNQNYRGADDMRLQLLSNAIMGTPNQATRTMTGAGDTAMMNAAVAERQLANDRARANAGFGWEDAAAILGNVGGSFLGNPQLGTAAMGPVRDVNNRQSQAGNYPAYEMGGGGG